MAEARFMDLALACGVRSRLHFDGLLMLRAMGNAYESNEWV
jgi:hypothetical protein